MTLPQLLITWGVPRLTPVATHEPLFALTVTLGGHVMPGGRALIVTVKAHVLVKLFVSVAEQVTVVVPMAKVSPERGEQTNVEDTQLDKPTSKFTTAVHWPDSAVCVTLPGQVRTHWLVGGGAAPRPRITLRRIPPRSPCASACSGPKLPSKSSCQGTAILK